MNLRKFFAPSIILWALNSWNLYASQYLGKEIRLLAKLCEPGGLFDWYFIVYSRGQGTRGLRTGDEFNLSMKTRPNIISQRREATHNPLRGESLGQLELYPNRTHEHSSIGSQRGRVSRKSFKIQHSQLQKQEESEAIGGRARRQPGAEER